MCCMRGWANCSKPRSDQWKAEFSLRSARADGQRLGNYNRVTGDDGMNADQKGITVSLISEWLLSHQDRLILSQVRAGERCALINQGGTAELKREHFDHA